METQEKIRIIKESFETLRARRIVKTQGDFAELLGVSAKSLSAAKNGVDGYCTDSLISKIQGLMKEYERPAIPAEVSHLERTGNEKMTAIDTQYRNVRCVPTIPIHAYRAVNFDVMEYFRETQDDVKMSPIVMQFPGTDCYYFVNSDDMTPHLQVNDLLCLSRLPAGARVTNGDICIINTKYQGIIERFVYDEGDHLLLKSTQTRWTDMRIPKKEIFNIFRILGGIRTNI